MDIKHWISTKRKYIDYIIIGVCTTAVSYGLLYLLHEVLHIEVNLANAISIAGAVIFAYWGNKIFVFRTHSESLIALWKEFSAFALSRGFTLVVELVAVFCLATLLGVGAMLSKVASSVVVTIINYFTANGIVFANKK